MPKSTKITVETKGKEQVVDITGQITNLVGPDTAQVQIFVQHTTCAVGTADLDPGGTDIDYLEALRKMIPAIDFRHPHNPAHMPDHILATLIGPDVTIPIADGKLGLGTWQRVVLFEFDGPRKRNLVVNIFRR